jgi:N-acetylmuramic acid 6-phosphate etherase
VMIRLGGVHEGLMVDVQANNAKLVERSESILRRLSGRSSEEVRDALRRARGNVKVAMLLLHGCSTDEAAGLLERAGGHLRTALRYAGHHETAASDVLTSVTDVSSVASESVGEK